MSLEYATGLSGWSSAATSARFAEVVGSSSRRESDSATICWNCAVLRAVSARPFASQARPVMTNAMIVDSAIAAMPTRRVRVSRAICRREASRKATAVGLSATGPRRSSGVPAVASCGFCSVTTSMRPRW
ncbi:hypothetical protein [Rhodococcus rhodochrous]|uniref:hypothetical protein n=1 Tax=Rhodococcus rhodochrous TaxID=1829 RepID=UPI0020B12811|nr:hypothetical protein [Rhodococcus rhodochrous]